MGYYHQGLQVDPISGPRKNKVALVSSLSIPTGRQPIAALFLIDFEEEIIVSILPGHVILRLPGDNYSKSFSYWINSWVKFVRRADWIYAIYYNQIKKRMVLTHMTWWQLFNGMSVVPHLPPVLI